MKCKICSIDAAEWFKEKIMNRHMISYFYCKNCGFLQTEEPYWLDEVYQDPVSIYDTGAAQRNITVAKKLSALLIIMFYGKGTYVDYAGGFGLLTRLMRDRGFDYYWNDKYAENLFSRGFEFEELGENNKKTALTAVECFEHLPDPLSSVKAMFAISDTLIFTTELLAEPPPAPKDWWYYALPRGGHISFYSKRTLNHLASVFEARYYKVGNFHVLSKKPIPAFLIILSTLGVKLNLGPLLSNAFLKGKTYSDYIHIQSRANNG